MCHLFRLETQFSLCKWWWRGLEERSSFWYTFLCAKYGYLKTLNFGTFFCSNTFSSIVIDIQQVGNFNPKITEVWTSAYCKVNNGGKTYIWEDL